MNRELIVKYGEIALRGKNRRLFEDGLVAVIKKNLKQVGGCAVIKENGRFVVRREGGVDYDETIPKIKNIPGLLGVCPCVSTEDRSLDNLKTTALNFINEINGNKKSTFKVETKRGDKAYPIKSPEISAEVGGFISENSDNFTVDVKNPDITLTIEIRNSAYFYADEIKCPGGLPPGSSGRGMALLSAGIDSPVACYLSMLRGVEIEAVYFHSPPYTPERALQKVRDVCERLAVFSGRVVLHAVPFTETQLKIKERTPPEKLTIMLKRSMLRIAEKIAADNKCGVLITGDSIGQVASQTLKSIEAVSSAVKMPVIRPLACLDKDEIITRAKKIGTYEISIRPYDDCCTLFVPKHPETKPKASIIESIEKSMEELPEIENRAIESKERFIINA